MSGIYSRQKMYPLPTEFPEDTKCWKIDIPDGDEYANLLVGAIYELTYWFNYLRDADKTGQVVAKYFQQAVLTLRNCGEGMIEDVRQNPLYPCKLDKKPDGGEWEEFANLRLCPPRLQIKDGEIQYSTDDGVTWVDYPNDGSFGGQPGEQPGGNEPIAQNSCKTIACLVRGDGIFIVPFRVQPTDTVQISAPQGVWYNDSVIGKWYCGSGVQYILGQCTSDDPFTPIGIDGVHKASRLIAMYGDAFLDPVGGVAIVPGGNEYPLVFRMNDADLSNNGGSMSFVAEICSGQWCTFLDFTLASSPYVSTDATWIAGQGYVAAYSNPTTTPFTFTLPDSAVLTVLWIDTPAYSSVAPAQYLPSGVTMTATVDGSVFKMNNLPASAVSGFTWYFGYSGSPSARVASIRLSGYGTNPFGSSNCE